MQNQICSGSWTSTAINQIYIDVDRCPAPVYCNVLECMQWTALDNNTTKVLQLPWISMSIWCNLRYRHEITCCVLPYFNACMATMQSRRLLNPHRPGKYLESFPWSKWQNMDFEIFWLWLTLIVWWFLMIIFEKTVIKTTACRLLQILFSTNLE